MTCPCRDKCTHAVLDSCIFPATWGKFTTAIKMCYSTVSLRKINSFNYDVF